MHLSVGGCAYWTQCLRLGRDNGAIGYFSSSCEHFWHSAVNTSGFKLGDVYLGSLLGETFHKFLGAFYTFENLGGEVASLVLTKFPPGQENIEKL